MNYSLLPTLGLSIIDAAGSQDATGSSLGVSISRFIMRRKSIFPRSQAGLPPNDWGYSRDNLQSLLPSTQQTAPDPASFLKSTKQCEATVSFFPPWLEMVEMFITQWEVVCETGVLFPSR